VDGEEFKKWAKAQADRRAPMPPKKPEREFPSCDWKPLPTVNERKQQEFDKAIHDAEMFANFGVIE